MGNAASELANCFHFLRMPKIRLQAAARFLLPLLFGNVFDEANNAPALGSTEISPVRREGESSASFLSAGSLRQASAEYRFSNYFALIRATNVGEGYLLTEDYRAL